MSWFGGKKHHATNNFFPVTAYESGAGSLTEDDTAWKTISGHGFQTETHTWYSNLPDGSIVMIQVIWSFLGVFLVPATAQMTFKLFNPVTKKRTWQSVNVNGFKTAGRSSSADVFNITHTGTPTTEETYHIVAKLHDVQLDVKFTKPANAAGWKYGSGPNAGYSNFGSQDPEKRDAFVIHRFHGFAISSGTMTIDGVPVDAAGQGMFVHAMQSGMRPNLIASRWNFAFFTGEDANLGKVNAIMMEFTTTDDYGPADRKGRTAVSIGCVSATSLPNTGLIVVGQTHDATNSYPVPNKDITSAQHLSVAKDADTGYDVPHGITFVWEGDRLDGGGRVRASIDSPDIWSGLIEKVDVLAEIPKILRKALAAATGTKPFIFQYQNAATLNLEMDGKTIPIKGWMFNEASYISA